MSKKLLRSIFAVFMALFMFGTSVNPAVYATGQEEETAGQKDPNETAVQEAPAESLTLGQTPDGSTDADEKTEKEVIRSFVLNDIPESVQSAEDLPGTLSAELEGEEADNVKVDVEWNEVTENDAVCFVPSLTEESEKSYTLSADAKSALKNVKVEKAAVAEEVKEPAEVKEPETKTDEFIEAFESEKTKEQAAVAPIEEKPESETGAVSGTDAVPASAKSADKTSNTAKSETENADSEEESKQDDEETGKMTVLNNAKAPSLTAEVVPEDAVASITDEAGTTTYYAYLEKPTDNPEAKYALKDWKTDTTLTLLKDVNLKNSISSPQYNSVTLDLNGHTLSTEEHGLEERIKIPVGSTLYLIDRSGTGKITGKNTVGGRGITVLGTLYLNGGQITGNSAGYSDYEGQIGGGVLVDGGTLFMNAGTISNNYARGNGGGVYVSNEGQFTMNGGEISTNTADGSSGGGGGIFVVGGSNVTITGGTISGNTTKGDGGGINVWNGSAEIVGESAVISGNTAGRGGGVYASDDGSFEMKTGTISDNSAEYGGGVFDDKSGGTSVPHFTLSGGSIKNNTASKNGGGVVFSTRMSLSGSPEVSGNTVGGVANDIYCRQYDKIQATGLIGNDSTIGIKMATPGDFTNGFNNAEPKAFFSDDENYVVALNDSTKEATLKQKSPHNVKIAEDITGGTVISNKATATEGETVTLTVTPGQGYALDDDPTVIGDETEDPIAIEKTAENTYTFVMPDEDVTVSALFNENILITLDFGADHQAVAEKIFAQWEDQLAHYGTVLGIASEVEFDGSSKITLRVNPTDTYYDLNYALSYYFLDLDDGPYVADCSETGEGLARIIFIAMGRSEIKSYADKNALIKEYKELESEELRELNGETYKMLWAEPIKKIDIKCKPLICGTSVHMTGFGPGNMQDPAPELSFEDETLVERDLPIWADLSKEGPDRTTFDVIGGNEYILQEQAMGSFGRIFTKDTEVIVNGVKMKYVPMDEESGRLGKNTFTVMGGTLYLFAGIEAEHEWGEWTITKYSTALEEGSRQRVCVHDKSHVETEPLPKVTYSIKTGDGQTWTKGSNVTADFEFERSEEYEAAKMTAYDLFTELQIDGIKTSAFKKEKGSVITKVYASYLDTLSAGEHKITAKFSDGGSVTASFTVKDKAPEPKPAPTPSNGGGSSKKPTKPVDNVVTCQMAGYPANYNWNEAAKACQPGYIDAGGNFHPYRTVIRKVPNTADRDIMIHAWIAMLSITIGLFSAVKLLHEDWEV